MGILSLTEIGLRCACYLLLGTLVVNVNRKLWPVIGLHFTAFSYVIADTFLDLGIWKHCSLALFKHPFVDRSFVKINILWSKSFVKYPLFLPAS